MSEKLGDILLRLGHVTHADLERALSIQKESGGERKLGDILCDFILDPQIVQQALSIQEGSFEPGRDLFTRILSYRLERKDITGILTAMNTGGQDAFLVKVAGLLEKFAAFIEVSGELYSTLSLDSLLKRILDITNETVGAEHSALFLYDEQSDELYSKVLLGGTTREIRFKSAAGIAGSVFTNGRTIIIHDAYADPRFNPEIDRQTGMRTHNILCAAVRTRQDKIIGVIELINKKDGSFSNDDVVMLQAITLQASFALQNASIHEELRRAKDEESKLLEVTTAISSELNFKPLLLKIMDTTTDMLEADRSTLFMYDDLSDELWSLVAQGQNQHEIRFRSHLGIAGSVFQTGETINIPEAYKDTRFNPEIDRKTNYLTRTILCMPIKNKDGKTIGVMQVLNKRGGPFTSKDERRLRAFSSQASIAIENARLFEDVLTVKNHNESILESMRSGIITLGGNLRIDSVNTSATDLLGDPPSTMLNLHVDEYFKGGNAWVGETVRAVIDSGMPRVVQDTELKLSNGRTVSVNMNAVPLMNARKEFSGTLLIIDNITREKRLRDTMSRYVSKEVADRLFAGDEAALGGKLQVATVLFSDIRGFTAFSERMGARETVNMLNEYFSLMVDIILRNGGILDKYIGDAKLAVFGAPFPGERDEDNAVTSAIEMLRALRGMNRSRIERGKEPIQIGIGINTDEVILGNIGSSKRMEYTVIGDGVNTASRLESANKTYHTRLLVSESTFRKLKRHYPHREVDIIRVKGKSQPVTVYEMLGYHDEGSFPSMGMALEAYARGMALYKTRDWAGAESMFRMAAGVNPSDGLAQIYIARCAHLLDHPMGDDWDGVWTMEIK